MEMLRLSKRMADLGICSRREADELIAQGFVKVNGIVVKEMGVKVSTEDIIEVSERGTQQLDQKVTFLIHKPVGYVSSQPEKNYKAAVELLIPENEDPQFSNGFRLQMKHLKGLAPAGRLDIDSKGLLILTQNGVLARKIIGENSNVEKEYLVRVQGKYDAKTLEKLRFGLELDEKKLKRAQVEELEPGLFKFILKEGKKRQIRRMVELVGLKVMSLKRVRVGKIMLGKLQEGHWRILLDHESID